MGSRSAEPLKPKTWQLEPQQNSRDGYLYYCGLCDEALTLTTQQIHPRKILLVFDETCPGCGFELENVLKCGPCKVPSGAILYTSSKCANADYLLNSEDKFESKLRRGSSLPRDPNPNITTGIDSLDKTLVLRLGQLAALHGEVSHSLSLLLCVRTILPEPEGMDSDVVFIDGGNIFETYTISQHAANFNLDPDNAQARIHLSRAFTHHQLNSLMTEKLPTAIDRYNARLTIVSDITQLYCDPDVREKREALDLFTKTVRFLASLAEQKNTLILATNLKSRNKSMDNTLTRAAHVSAKLEERGTYTQLTVARHPFIPQHHVEVVTFDNQTLGAYL